MPTPPPPPPFSHGHPTPPTVDVPSLEQSPQHPLSPLLLLTCHRLGREEEGKRRGREEKRKGREGEGKRRGREEKGKGREGEGKRRGREEKGKVIKYAGVSVEPLLKDTPEIRTPLF